MASRILARSKALALAALSRAGAGSDAAPPLIAGLGAVRALSSLPRHPAAASPLGLGKVLGYQTTYHHGGAQVLPRWFSAVASDGSHMEKPQISKTYKSDAEMKESDAQNSREGGRAPPKVLAFSPLEAAIAKPRSSPLTRESFKVRVSEVATQVTFVMIPALLLSSKNRISTSLLVGIVFHQVYVFHKEILLDYVHHEITRKWALIYLKLLLLVMAKDTIMYFNLV